MQKFQKNISTAMHKEWYISFYNESQAIILFKNKLFQLDTTGINPIRYQLLSTVNAKDKRNWDAMIAYAKSIGVPDNQCDFLPDDYISQNYE